ncbi:RfbB dTDP-D-glucose 4,6-dehydratase [Candidatus Planktophila versatilis]|uniref:dTDP-glucose 4,6-dehydratase n=1 Tax=Candidatus Planktophila versatilis TaxID=1884905 RepID=UPI003BEF4399
MRILVTGGFGFIGSEFSSLAHKSGHHLTIIDKMTYAADTENLSPELKSKACISNLDISDSKTLTEFLSAQESFDYIVNFAAESHVDRSIKNGVVFVNSNVLGTVNLLEYLKNHPETKMLQVSTDEVYGSIDQGSWNEDFPLSPRSPYSSSKASAELFCLSYQTTHNVKVVITRCANNFGPRQSAEKLIPTIISSVLDGRKIPIYGDGHNRREWIYVADHAAALLRIVEGNPKHVVYNIGGTEMTNLELAAQLVQILGVPQSEIVHVTDRLGHDKRYSVNHSRFVLEFGKIQNDEIASSLINTVDWYKSNLEWLHRSQSRLSV